MNRGRYIFRPPGEKDTALGRVSEMTKAEVYKSVEQLSGNNKDDVKWLISLYKESEHLDGLKSKKAINQGLDRLIRIPLKGGGKFGDVKLKDVTPGLIRKLLDYCGNTTINRDIANFSKAWSWCYERDHVRLINPCKGVSRNPESDRSYRYITDEEYQAVFDVAKVHVKVAMEIAYACRMRISEVLDTRVKDIEDDGLNTRRLKGSNDALTLWSPRLKKAVDIGLEGCVRVPDMPIVNTRSSEGVHDVKYQSFYDAFTEATEAAKVEDFHFHDIKAKGASDFTGNKKDAGGWKSDSMVPVYDRKRKTVKATE